MKILYHHRTMGDGAEGIHIREIVTALRTLGHDVQIVALAGDPTGSTGPNAARLGVLRRMIPGFAYEVAEIAYNVVGYRRILDAVRRFAPDAIYDRYNSYSTAALKAARRTGLPLLLEVNAPVAYERRVYEHLPLKFPRLAARYERRIVQGADRIFAVSTPLKSHLVEVLRIDPRKIVVLPNGADPAVFAPADGRAVRDRYAIDHELVVGFVGILRPWHGVELLLDAFRELRDRHSAVHLLILGDGPIRPDLEARARRLKLEHHVTFTGRISHADVVSHIAAMDIAVSPRATFYASPMKILEYMAMEKPVVAPAMDNIRDLVKDGRTGLLFEPEDVSALAAKLIALAGDERLRRALGAEGRRRVLEELNWRRNAARIADEAAVLAGAPATA